MSDQISLSIADPGQSHPLQKLGSTLVALGLLATLIALFGLGDKYPLLFFFLIVGLITTGGIFYYLIDQFVKNALK